jgi:hypothetical protein
VARSIRTHLTLILNWFAAKKEFSPGIVEGLNYRIKLTLRKAYDFCTLAAVEKSPRITPRDAYPSRNSPTNPAEETFLYFRSSLKQAAGCRRRKLDSIA